MATLAPKRHSRSSIVTLPDDLRAVERWARTHAPSKARRATATRYHTSPAAQQRRDDAARAREREWLYA